MELKLNYEKLANLPILVSGYCQNNRAFIVGSAASYLLDLKSDYPKDWDLIVSPSEWKSVSRTFPQGSYTNSFGGVKLTGDVEIDIWADEIDSYIQGNLFFPVYAVYPKGRFFLYASRKITKYPSIY